MECKSALKNSLLFVFATGLLCLIYPAYAEYDALKSSLHSGDSPSVLIETINHLSYAGYKEGFWDYVRYLDYAIDEESGSDAYLVRKAAAEALGRIRDDRAIPYLVERFAKEKKDQVSGSIIFALSYYPCEQTNKIVAEGLISQNDIIRYEATIAVVKISAKNLIPDLQKEYIAEKDDSIKMAALYALSALGSESEKNNAELVSGLKNRDPVVRYRSADYIGRLKLVSALKNINSAIEIENKYWVLIQLENTKTILHYEIKKIREDADRQVVESVVYGDTNTETAPAADNATTTETAQPE